MNIWYSFKGFFAGCTGNSISNFFQVLIYRFFGRMISYATDPVFDTLLWDDYDEWLNRFQKIIRQTVQYFSFRFSLDTPTKQDLEQDINMFLLRKKTYLLKQCSADGNPSGFFRVVINRECMHLIKRIKRREFNLSVVPPTINTDLTSDQKEKIITETIRLEAILKTYYTKQASMQFMIKLSIHFPVNENDIEECFKDLDDSDKTIIMEHSAKLQMMTEQQAFRFMNPYFNKQENKSVNFDSRVKRTGNHINDIAKLLNEGGKYHYERETVEYLFEIYFSLKEKSKS